MDFTHERLAARIVFGPGRRKDAAREIASLGASRVLVVGGSHDSETIARLRAAVDLPSEAIIGVRPHVPAEAVRGALDTVDRFGPDLVVTVGGGSATGLGKMVALERDVNLMAIPTTYAGSEMTPIWGTSEHGRKTTGRSDRVVPRVVIYDPELTVGLPMSVTVNSSFNALAHCVEALWLDGTSPITAEAAIGAIRSIVGSVASAAARPDDIEARSALLYGAHRAGEVLASAGTGILHQTAHVLGGMFDLDHGAMYAVLTPIVVRRQASQKQAFAASLTTAIGPTPVEALSDLAAELDAPTSLASIGFPQDRLSAAAEAVASRTRVPIEEVTALLDVAVRGPRSVDATPVTRTE